MENPNQQVIEEKEVPAYRKPADRRTESVGFRIYRDQSEYLDNNLKSDKSKLIRFLLDYYIQGKIGSPEIEFQTERNKKDEI